VGRPQVEARVGHHDEQQHAAAGEVGGERALTGTHRAARHHLPRRGGPVLGLEETGHDLNLGGAAVPADRSKVSAAATMVAHASPLGSEPVAAPSTTNPCAA
jgi:hypothetical protein